MDDTLPDREVDAAFRAILHPHRSLSPRGFTILMAGIGGISFVTGLVFLLMGAWPVFGFFGLDVLVIWLAFKLNYRSGRAHEIVELTPQLLTVTRVTPAGRRQRFDFNPYWVRVRLSQRVDGRTDLSLASHGQEFSFGRLLNDDERRDFATALQSALANARTTPAAG
jgi:uncharacterized membrane protein